ncbi:MAG: hypothetical protein R6U95_03040 [Bacteroidales bacterium]
MKNKTLLLVLLFLTSICNSFSQEQIKGAGLSASIQESQYGIIIPIRFNDKFGLAPAFTVMTAQNNGSDLGFSLAVRFYNKKENISPYFGLRFGTLIYIPSSTNQINKDNTIDILGGIAYGGEYYFSDKFSCGIEAQGNITKSDKNSDRLGNPDGINFNLGTMLFFSIYF